MSEALLAEAKWYPYWDREDGACPACVQQNLLQTLLAKGDAALHEAIQTAWPLDAEAAFGVLPTRLRLHADPRFSGKGITIALVDAGFYPHPDLVQPRNRIRVWANATHDSVSAIHFEPDETPRWPDWDGARDWQVHVERHAAARVALGQRDDQPEVGLHQVVLGPPAVFGDQLEIEHTRCRAGGDAVLHNAAGLVWAVNLGCVEGLDPFALKISVIDGNSLPVVESSR